MKFTIKCMAFVAALVAADSRADFASDIEIESEAFLRELVSFESTQDRTDEVHRALQSVERRLLDGGFAEDDVTIINPGPGSWGLVARYPGSGFGKPVLVIAHIDVVQAIGEDWDFPPFTLGKKDGFYLGRGVDDNKAGVVQSIGNMIRLKKEGWVPRRDIVAFISGDEENDARAAEWMTTEGRQLVDAGMVLNTDAGSGKLNRNDEPVAFWLQTSEKLYQTYRLTTHNPGGHSSVPRPDNAIRDLAQAIIRITDYQFPVRVNESTLLALKRAARFYPPDISRDMLSLAATPHDRSIGERLARKDPVLNTWLRTTCVPTQLEGGQAENALPREASVIVQCRIMPGVPPKDVQARLEELVEGLDVEFEIVWDGLPSDVSRLPADLLERFEELVEQHWPDTPVIPSMSSGATDGLYFRNAGVPVYGMGALFSGDEGSGAHGLNERIRVRSFHDSMAFWCDLIRMVGDDESGPGHER